MLRLPAAGDTPPPLMAPLRVAEAPDDAAAAEAEPRKVKRRRRGRKPAENLDWEAQPSGSRRGEHGQMRLMLIGGFVLFALIVGGVIFLLNSGNDTVARSAPPVSKAEPVTEEGNGAAEAITATPSKTATLADAEKVAREFLEATSLEAMLPLVRNPGQAEARMKAFYAASPYSAPGLSAFNFDQDEMMAANHVSVLVRTADFETQRMAIFQTPDGKKVDWESWVGWSEMPWSELASDKPAAPKLFRVTLSEVDYYNFDFSDDAKWQSYRLESADREHVVFGYVEKGSALDKSLNLDADTPRAEMTVLLKFPEGATSANQVLIESLVAKGWVLDSE